MAYLELILQEIRQFRQENNEKLKTIKEEIIKANGRIDEAEGRIVKAEERIQNAEEVMTEMLKLHMKVEDKLTDLESRTRQENMLIYGVPEGSEKESPTMIAFVETLLREGLGVKEELPDLQHTDHSDRNLQKAPPSSIVVKFLSFKTKETLLHKAWKDKGFVWQENKVNLDHDFPPLVMKKWKE